MMQDGASAIVTRLLWGDGAEQGVKFIIECDYFTGRVLEIDGGIVL